MDTQAFDKIIDDKPTSLYQLKNRFISCYFTNYGARLVSLQVENGLGESTDVVLGFDTLDKYIQADEQYHGATVGRYANRIADGKFTLNGTVYTLDQNNGPNSLHGGIKALHNSVWSVVDLLENCIEFEILSPHLDQGFPGDMTIRVKYTLQGSDLIIEYEAESSEDTVVNLTHHSYFNLNGEGSGNVLDHYLNMNSSYMTPVNENIIPTGKVDLVLDTPFDFTKGKKIGTDINDDHIQLKRGSGYDHNFVIDHYQMGVVSFIAKAKGELSNISMEVWSTEPGVQFYSANHLSGKDVGKSGRRYESRHAFCLETQHFPDSPNQENFPSTLLKKGERYHSKTEYRFSIE